MINLLFKVVISYKDINELPYQQKYELYATDKDNAKKLALELLNMEEGITNISSIEANLVPLSKMELNTVNNRLITKFGVLCNQFENLNYKDFILRFMQYNGYDLVIASPNRVQFKFKFMGFTCVAKFIDGVSFIEKEDVIYTSDSLRRTYVIKNNLTEIYVGIE